MPGVPREYIGLMRDAINQSDSTPSAQRPIKKRKRNRTKNRDKSAESLLVDIKDQGSSVDNALVVDSSTDEPLVEAERKQDLNAIPLIDLSEEDHLSIPDLGPEGTVYDNEDVENDEEDDEEDDEFDDAEFEDVDLDSVKPRASSNLTGDISVNMNEQDLKPKKKVKAKNVIDREERIFRKNFHRNHIAIMSIHGFVRNRWCNNKAIHKSLTKLIPSSVYDELHPPKNIETPHIRTRRFLDGLRHLLDRWSKYYKVTSNKGIYKHDWYDWYGYEKSKVPFSRFIKCITKGRGNRDIGAQGFVALLRAAGVASRLVFSLQPPDFTSMAIRSKPRDSESNKTNSGHGNPREKLLELRKGKVSTSVDQKVEGEVELQYPVFWAEAWDSSSKTWITIDPVLLKVIENVRVKSRLEPPSNYRYNNLVYVLGYDRKGGVRDITKRYAEKYYARTRKKRITKYEADEIWYTDFLETMSSRGRNRSDDFEDEYFQKKATLEGMPDNIQDFKGHPFYVLESHLKANEILHPKEHCGMIRTKGKNNSVKVYKRENVQTLRTPRAWFQRGRVLKTGERPMMVRKKTPAQIRDDDDDPEERLYAIFQTKVYVPPPVKEGLITKNAYGNIDVYVPSMIPDGAVLINTPYAADAAKLIGVDYANAVVGFKFERRGATPKIEGIVVAEEFQEAVGSVQEQLKAEAIEKQRSELELRALKGWTLLLAKLRIKHRLNAHHGKVFENGETGSDHEYDELEREYEEYLENDESDDDASEEEEEEIVESPAYGPGGFIVEKKNHEPEYGAGGFIGTEDSIEMEENRFDGGFVREEELNDDQKINEFGTDREGSEIADSGGEFLMEDEDNGSYYDPNDSDGELYHVAGFNTENNRNVSSKLESPGLSPEPAQNTGIESANEQEPINDLGDMDEYEAFFNQLQNNNQSDSGEYISSDNENSPPRKVTEKEIYEVHETEQNTKREALTKEDPEKSSADNSSVKDVDDGSDEIKIPLDENSDCESGIEEIQKKFTEPLSLDTKGAITEGYDEELEKEFNEQLNRENNQTLSQSTKSGSTQDEDYEFDYDSE